MAKVESFEDACIVLDTTVHEPFDVNFKMAVYELAIRVRQLSGRVLELENEVAAIRGGYER